MRREGLFVLVIGLAAMGGTGSAAEESPPPPVVYTLLINGEQHEVVPDQPLSITGTFENPTLTLSVAKDRRFQGEGIAFQYPAYFTYEDDTADADVQSWTFSGNDVTVILFQFAETVPPADLTDSTAEALDAKVQDSQPVKLKLGDREHAGIKATMNFASQSLIQQTVMLPGPKQGSRLLVIQEVRSDGEPESTELSTLLKLLASSLVIQP